MSFIPTGKFNDLPIGAFYRITEHGGIYLKTSPSTGICIKRGYKGTGYNIGDKVNENLSLTVKQIKRVEAQV